MKAARREEQGKARMISVEEEITAKMRAAGQPETAIRAFLRLAACAGNGAAGWIRESDIEPPRAITAWEDLPQHGDPEWVKRLAVIKLNGGLGTGMGLERAKSLLPVKDGASFLSLIRRQLAAVRSQAGVLPHFVLLNSFSTRDDTRAALRAEPIAGAPEPWEMMQSMVPKLDAETFRPVSWPRQPELEWCPPGHGDIYPTLASGMLRTLQEAGVEFLFVSNADNLGATPDLRILTHFAQQKVPLMMEVARRTPADRKGGHLACRRRDGRLILRESAQCAPEDEAVFQDISRHCYFNTNNLWLRMDALAEALERGGGFLELPLIINRKTVDPRDKTSLPVLQLETAMGAAIEIFDGATALAVPRFRFAPVKSTADLLVIRSDAYWVDKEGRLQPDPVCASRLPLVVLDETHYKMIGDFERRFARGIPSLKHCQSLTVKGDWTFEPGVVFEGEVELNSTVPCTLPAGTYRGRIDGCWWDGH